jgi:hypothetical protein
VRQVRRRRVRGARRRAVGPPTRALETIDWRSTRAFAIPAHYTPDPRTSPRARGVVEPGRARRALLDEIEADLRWSLTRRPGARRSSA